MTKLKEAILQLEQKFTMEQDTMQINASDFNPDINRQNSPRAHNNTATVSVQEQLTSPKPEIPDATNFPEKNTDRDPPDTTNNNSEESHGCDNFPLDVQNCTTEQHQNTSEYSINPEEIPQLEEDSDNGQFADIYTNLINRHNTHCERERIA